jgi:hypothetical protein
VKAYANQPWPRGQYKRYRARNACHRNAWSLAINHEHLTLVKGYARLSPVWVGHWWCADEQDRVVDPSWNNEGVAYVGEPVSKQEVTRMIIETRESQLLLERSLRSSLCPP